MQYHLFQQQNKILEPNGSGAKMVFSTNGQGFLNQIEVMNRLRRSVNESLVK